MIELKEYETVAQKLNDNFRRADKIIQEIKVITNEEPIPAVLQLRYAGTHISEWLITGKDSDLQAAETHSKRAIFEAARHGALFCFAEIVDFRKSYGGDILPNIITDYSVKMQFAEKARKETIIDGNEEERVDACMNSFYKLKDILEEFIACQPDLNAVRSRNLQNLYWQILAASLSVAGVILAAMAIIHS